MSQFPPEKQTKEMNAATRTTAQHIIQGEKSRTVQTSGYFHIRVQETTECARMTIGRSELTVCTMNHTGERRSRAAGGGCRCGHQLRFDAFICRRGGGGRGRVGSGEWLANSSSECEHSVNL